MIAENSIDPARGHKDDPAGVALDSLHWHAEAERRHADVGEELCARVLCAVALWLREGVPPDPAPGNLSVFSRRLHAHLASLGRSLGLDPRRQAEVAADLAEWYDPRSVVMLLPDWQADCVAACADIPPAALKSGVVGLLWLAAADAEREIADQPEVRHGND